MLLDKPYDQAIQPSFFSLCLNAFYLKQKSGIDVYVPCFHHLTVGAKAEFNACINTIAESLMVKLKEKESIAVMMPCENAVESEYAHVSTLIFRREGKKISCIIYDSVMTVQSPTVELFEAIARQETVKKLDVFISNGVSQADNFSCRTKSLVESSVALRYPNPLDNVGEIEGFPEYWEHRNPKLVDLENKNSKVAVQFFQRNTYPDKTAQLTGYHSQHPKVIDNSIGYSKHKSLQEHVRRYTHKIFLSTKPIDNGLSIQPGGISFDKSMNVYLKLKGIQVASRARAIVDAIKLEYGEQYKDILNEIMEHHSLRTAPANSWSKAENQLKENSELSWCGT